MKILIKIAHFLDQLTIIVLTVAFFACLFNGLWIMALWIMATKGIWCCSMTLMEIKKHLTGKYHD